LQVTLRCEDVFIAVTIVMFETEAWNVEVMFLSRHALGNKITYEVNYNG